MSETATYSKKGSVLSPAEPFSPLPLLLANTDDTPEKDFSGQLRLRIPQSLHRQLSQTAEKEGVSLNMMLVYLLSGNHKEHYLIRNQVIVQNSQQLQVNVVARETKLVTSRGQVVEFYGAPTLYELG